MEKFSVLATIVTDEMVRNKTGKTHIIFFTVLACFLFSLSKKFLCRGVAMEYQLQKKCVKVLLSAL
jgi:hypothetical protein